MKEKEAFSEGKLAFANGIPFSENPYINSNENLALQWESGWNEASKSRNTFLGKNIEETKKYLEETISRKRFKIPFSVLRLSGDILRQTHNTKAWIFAFLALLWSIFLNFSPVVIGIFLLFRGEILKAILIPIGLYLLIGFYLAFWPVIAILMFISGWIEYGFLVSLSGTVMFVVIAFVFLSAPEWLMYRSYKAAEKAETYKKGQEVSTSTNIPNINGNANENYTLENIKPTYLVDIEEQARKQNIDNNIEEGREGKMKNQSDVLDKIAAHLEFLGYQIEKKEEYVLATHSKKANIWIRPGSGGFFIQATYIVGEKAKSDRNRFIEAINELNGASISTRFWTNKQHAENPSLFMDMWIPDFYDKTYFGTIIDSWHYDTVTLLFQNDSIKEFFM